MDLIDCITLMLGDVSSLNLINDDDESHTAKPLNQNLCKIKAFLLLYNQNNIYLSSTLDEEDVLSMTRKEFNDYCGTHGYHNDLSTGLSPSTKTTTSTQLETTKLIASDSVVASNATKQFNSWNHSFVVVAVICHTQNVIDASHKPVNASEIFKEVQIFMYAVFEYKLKTDKGNLLVSNCKTTRVAQCI
jgi:hypothetical protein